ncbi:MAG TPA: hypothetical protein VNZ49_09960 [Bacteroidia bacterium]|jgi:hypothetical protein|nr:hypothetical protein [Bacteroidia bacterium]
MQKVITFLIILAASAVSCHIAFINGYPLVYPDTGEYLNSGFESTPPYDRTIFYGLFARHISLFYSLWIVVFAQAILVCSLIFTVVGIFFTGKIKYVTFLALTLALNMFTGFSYQVSIIMPDVFTAAVLLCFIIILFHNNLNRIQSFLIYFIFVFSIATQVSNFFVVFSVLLLLFLLLFIRRKRVITLINFKKLLLSFYLFCFTLILVPSVHFMLGGKFSISNGSHVFIMNHFLETGILKKYLDENCSNKNYKICAYKDSLGNNLMWEINGPLYKTGGWEANKEEYSTIICDIVSSPVLLKELCTAGIKGSMKQFFTYKVSIAPPQLENTAPYEQVIWRFEKESISYFSSRQNKNGINTDVANGMQSFFIPVCMWTSLLVLLIYRKYALGWAAGILFIYSICNAVICANFSTIDDRYQGRLIWMFMLVTVIAIVKWRTESFPRITKSFL